MELLLCRLKHIANYFYSTFSSYSNEKNEAVSANSKIRTFLIKSLKIVNSIFSPPIIKATINFSEASDFIKYYSVYGVGFYKNSKEPQTNQKLTCLFSNTDTFVPFVVADYSLVDDGEAEVVLIEKRALALALTHSFAVVAKAKSALQNDETKGLISIAEVVENLSKVPEDEDDINSDLESNLKNSISFQSASIHRQSESSNLDCKNEKIHCAFISRYITPASQSRLRVILSLLYKYGYGLVYRPADRQYHAFELLSMTAPGFEKKGATCNSVYPAVYTFDGKENDMYFTTYSSYCKKYSPDSETGGSKKSKGATKESTSTSVSTNLPSNFADFFINRVIGFADKKSSPSIHAAECVPRDYYFISRYTPLASATNYITDSNNSDDKFGFDLVDFSRTSDEDLKSQNLKTLIEADKNNIQSVFSQHNRYTDVAGGIDYHYEDQVELNFGGFGKKRYNSNSRNAGNLIQSVNQRLIHARYKLNHMIENYATWHFSFCNNNGLSREYNIVYELFSRLGYHTDIFARAYQYTELKVRGNGPNKASYTISEGKVGENSNIDKNFANFINNFYTSNPYDVTGAIFGKFTITINAVDNPNVSATESYSNYDTNVSMTFYNDLVFYNFKIDDEQPNFSKNKKTNKPDYPPPPPPPPSQDKTKRTKHFYLFTFKGKDYIIDHKIYYQLSKHKYMNLWNLGGKDKKYETRNVGDWDENWLTVVKNYLVYKRSMRFATDLDNIRNWAAGYNATKELQRQFKSTYQSAMSKLKRDYPNLDKYPDKEAANNPDYADVNKTIKKYNSYTRELKEYNRLIKERTLPESLAHCGWGFKMGKWRELKNNELTNARWGTYGYTTQDIPDKYVEDELAGLEKQSDKVWIGKERVKNAREAFELEQKNPDLYETMAKDGFYKPKKTKK